MEDGVNVNGDVDVDGCECRPGRRQVQDPGQRRMGGGIGY
jgi:hypothetical protein